METCYGPRSKHQSIYTLQNSYSLVAEEYLQSLAAKGFKPENPERLILKIEDYKAENIQLLMTQQHCNPSYCPWNIWYFFSSSISMPFSWQHLLFVVLFHSLMETSLIFPVIWIQPVFREIILINHDNKSQFDTHFPIRLFAKTINFVNRGYKTVF